ncbi:type IV pilin [Halorubrum kocurii]|nr:type IV pilin N-terminal domain-containing protein [Halorubrum kocurii]
MNLKSAFQDSERAVSPVIGVILMVAITVILAAVIGTFVLGLGDSLGGSAPTASIDAEVVENSGGDDEIRFTHEGGDTIELDNLEYVTSNSNVELGSASPSSSGDFSTASTTSVAITGPDTSIETTTISLVFNNGDTSATLASIEVEGDGSSSADDSEVTVV